MIHELPLERRTLHGHYSRELPPIVTVDPGDTIAFSCPNARWEYEHGVRFEPYDEELDAGHALVGPVEVRGAKASSASASSRYDAPATGSTSSRSSSQRTGSSVAASRSQ